MNEKFLLPTIYIGDNKSYGDVTSGITHPLAAEILVPPFYEREKALKT
jgi:hypothetical protein